jgi:F0F1-type ATP synthase assembly protein I
MKYTERKSGFDFRALELALRLGYTIALPIVIFGIGGRLLDKKLNTSPLFLIGGIILSIIISTVAIVKTVAPILERMARGDEAPKEKNKKQ